MKMEDTTVIEFLESIKNIYLKESKESVRLWNIKDLSLYFNMSIRSVDRMRKSVPDFPNHLMIGKAHRWHQDVIKNWAKRQAA